VSSSKASNPSAPIAVLLLSGGLDSATVLAIAQADGFLVHALSIDYGQKQRVELDLAAELAGGAGCASHTVLRVPLDQIGGSALTDSGIEVPKGRSVAAIGTGIPSTYVPARNTVMLSLALALAEARGARHLFLGINALDYSGYPDCRPAFVEAFEQLANRATRAADGGEPYRLHAPLLHLTKAQIITRGRTLGVDYSRTRSCYEADDAGLACGGCDACILRLAAFAELGFSDPAGYR
jgi:7-cyano-7-deazaguanine synthase